MVHGVKVPPHSSERGQGEIQVARARICSLDPFSPGSVFSALQYQVFSSNRRLSRTWRCSLDDQHSPCSRKKRSGQETFAEPVSPCTIKTSSPSTSRTAGDTGGGSLAPGGSGSSTETEAGAVCWGLLNFASEHPQPAAATQTMAITAVHFLLMIPPSLILMFLFHFTPRRPASRLMNMRRTENPELKQGRRCVLRSARFAFQEPA